MRRVKYLQDMDDVQNELIKSRPHGLTLSQLMEVTNRNYAAMQQATVRLLNADRITVRSTPGKRNLYFSN